MNYTNYFERVVVINLKRRPERKQRLEKLIKSSKWPFGKPIWFNAVDGSVVPVANKWGAGGGAWGCKRSWCRVLEEALNDGVQSILVLEDDAIWRGDFSSQVDDFLKKVPANWECLFFGGQNMKTPKKVSEGVYRATNTQRTHCIGLQRDGIRKAYINMMDADWHIDHKFGPESGKWGTAYQPEPFLVGQDACKSDISGRNDHTRFWMAPSKTYPVCWIQCPSEVMTKLSQYGFHRGFDRTANGRDRGLASCFPRPGNYAGRIKKFLGHASWEAASFEDDPGIVTVWDPNATEACSEKLLREMPERAFIGKFETFEEGLELLKNHFGDDLVRMRRDQKLLPIVLVKSPADVVKQLKDTSLLHFGRWINKQSQIDQGLIYFFDKFAGTDLSEWFKVLNREAEGIGVPVAVWHPKATVEACETTGRDVLVVDAMTIEGAVAQIQEGTR